MAFKCDKELKIFIENANNQNPNNPFDISKFFYFVHSEYVSSGYIDGAELKSKLLTANFPEIVADRLVSNAECICFYEKWKAGKL